MSAEPAAKRVHLDRNSSENDKTAGHIEQLEHWLSSNGAKWPKLRICQLDGFGLGAQCTEDIDSEEAFMKLPRSLIIDVHTARNCSIFGEVIRQVETRLCQDPVKLDSTDAARVSAYLCLALHKGLEKESFWYPYIQALPTEFSTALWLSESIGNELLADTPLSEAIDKETRSLRQLYDCIVPFLNENSTNIGSSSSLSYDTLKWAHSCFYSRALCVPGVAGAVSEALVPLVDILNHRPGALTEFTRHAKWPQTTDESSTTSTRIEASLEKEKSDVIYVKSRSRIKQGEQVFINYGAKSNHELLLHFGFCIENNPADTYMLTLGPIDWEVAIQGHFYRSKSEWENIRLCISLRPVLLPLTHILTQWSVPSRLLDTVRTLCMQATSELESWLQIVKGEQSGYGAFVAVYGREAAAHLHTDFDEELDSIEERRRAMLLGSDADDSDRAEEQLFEWDSIGSPWSRANERVALSVLIDTIEQRVTKLHESLNMKENGEQNEMGKCDSDQAVFRSNVTMYKTGLLTILNRTHDVLQQLRHLVPSVMREFTVSPYITHLRGG